VRLLVLMMAPILAGSSSLVLMALTIVLVPVRSKQQGKGQHQTPTTPVIVCLNDGSQSQRD
jgi:hypothetical protein